MATNVSRSLASTSTGPDATPLARRIDLMTPETSEPPPCTLASVPLNTADIPRHELDISSQTRANPLPWKGQFSPQLVESLLKRYASPGSQVFDPFLGSGTVLAECIRRQLNASGSEINPAASILSRLYTLSRLQPEQRRSVCDAALQVVQQHLFHDGSEVPPIAPSEARPQDIASIARQHADPSVATVIAAALVLSDPTWSTLSVQRLIDSLRRIRQLLVTLPNSCPTITVFDSDARRVPLPDNSVDLVITSPPYINVFNYHQQYRPAVEALDIDVLEAARSEIGSNRKHRMNRFLTVIQYAIDMAAVLAEMKRLLRPAGRMIFVVGRESRVRGMAIMNGDLLCSIASGPAHLAVPMRQERAFTNRFGERIVEDILHFEHDSGGERLSVPPPVIAQRVLRALQPLANGEVLEDIELAIASIDSVSPSALYAGASS